MNFIAPLLDFDKLPSVMVDEVGLIRKSVGEKARRHGLPKESINAFLNAVQRICEGEIGLIREHSIEPVSGLPKATELETSRGDARALIHELAVVKLNGGLGTGMGLAGPKSLLRVKGDDTFLDLIAKQILGFREQFGRRQPAFYLMNSFSTQRETLSFLKRYPRLPDQNGQLDFLQSKVPKLLATNLMPASHEADPELEWCPPGHGDIYPSLISSGLLDSLLSRGVKYLFVSNSDNLGATVDASLLGHFARSGAGFMMEVARRTAADRKGGHLARRRADARLVLRESAQCASDEVDRFQDVDRYQYFNTNNLWIQLEQLRTELDRREGVLELPIIRNEKPLNPRELDSPKVLQLESAMGAAIECFSRAIAVEVPRCRFSPVKTTSDLLGLWSDAYVVTADHRLVLDPSRNGCPPVTVLDPDYFKFISDFALRFPQGVPSMLGCEKLTVRGDVTFLGGVECHGQICFENESGHPQIVEAGVYHDQVVRLN